MNGAGGNLAAIQASRMTTYLNKATSSLFGVFPAEDNVVCVLPCSAFCGGLASPCGAGPGSYHATMARVRSPDPSNTFFPNTLHSRSCFSWRFPAT